MTTREITVDGCTYTLEISHDGDVLFVYDCEGNRVASAEKDHHTEEVYYDYYDEEGKMKDFGGWMSDLFDGTPGEIAYWLVSTHPCN